MVNEVYDPFQLTDLLKTHKTEIDRKPTSALDRNSTSAYKYSLTNTHKGTPGISSQEKQKTLVFRDATLRQGFAQVPNVVLRDYRLSGNERTLYALLLSYAWQDDECFPGQDTLAKDMGLTGRSIRLLLSGLKAKKLIGWKPQGLGNVNIYHIRKLTDAYPLIIDPGSNF